jgi:regulator of protease activity HflC (stomatin/prohibitin superfamily)
LRDTDIMCAYGCPLWPERAITRRRMMTSTQNRNEYLDRVVAEQQVLEQNLKAKRIAPAGYSQAAAPAGPVPPPAAPRGRGRAVAMPLRAEVAGGPASDGAAAERGSGVEVRVTGFWRWKTVLVPPNAFVVHTRRGRPEPLHVGLGVSFRYRPAIDAFLVVPGAMQTILISAFSICRELQGVVVQAYVQWIIEDFATAYRRLDFSDPDDPMRLVNLQLKEQAEAAIKDKVATMSVHEVLSDKQPIIEELTARLRAVAEGEGDRDAGLGLRIVTVQIKEAVVSSSRLWENLQKPYRSEQERVARLAELTASDAISERESQVARARETRNLADERELAELRHRNESAGFDRDTAERIRRAAREQEDARTLADLENETTVHALALRRARQQEEYEVNRQRLEADQALRALAQEGELAIARAQATTDHDTAILELDRERIRGDIANAQSDASIQAQFVERLPEIVAKLPKPAELRAVTIGGADSTSLSGLVAELAAVIAALRDATKRT